MAPMAAMPEAKANAGLAALRSRRCCRSSASRVGFCVRRVLEALVLAERLLHVGRRLVDRRDDGAGRRIGLLAGVEADGAEPRVRCELHDPATIHLLISRSPRTWPDDSRAPESAHCHAPIGATVSRQRCFNTLPGRAIVVGLAVKLVVFARRRSRSARVPAFFSVVDTVAGLAIAAGVVYFLFRLLVLAKRRLLWRVRRKLILSYIFIGFVPALLHRRVLLCCAASCCSTTSARISCRAGCAR